jgi:hypothetical protein
MRTGGDRLYDAAAAVVGTAKRLDNGTRIAGYFIIPRTFHHLQRTLANAEVPLTSDGKRALKRERGKREWLLGQRDSELRELRAVLRRERQYLNLYRGALLRIRNRDYGEGETPQTIAMAAVPMEVD